VSICLFLFLLGNGSIKCILLSLLGRNSVKTFPRQRRIEGIAFYCAHVVSNDSRRLVLPRTCFLFHMFVVWLALKQWDLYLQQMNMEADQLCKIAKTNSEKMFISVENTRSFPILPSFYVCVRGGPNQPLHRDLQWSIVLMPSFLSYIIKNISYLIIKVCILFCNWIQRNFLRWMWLQ
jgi:hypothetical protein